MTLSKKLKGLRKQNGLSQLQLSEKLRVSRQAVSGWEAGSSRPSTENLQGLSKLYSVPLEYLLDDDADKPELNNKIAEEPGFCTCSKKESSKVGVSCSDPVELNGGYLYICDFRKRRRFRSYG